MQHRSFVELRERQSWGEKMGRKISKMADITEREGSHVVIDEIGRMLAGKRENG